MNPGSHPFDRRTERELRTGSIRIEGRLDLHGMNQVQAHAALKAFLTEQVAARHRRLLIITGQGGAGGGVLKRNLRGWIEALPEAARIIDMRAAAAKHGGEGAVYVWLRKGR